MFKIIKLKKHNIIFFSIWLLLIIIFMLLSSIIPIYSVIIIISFLFFNALINFFPKSIKMSLPVMVYRLTGFIRYVIIPLSILYQNVSFYYSLNICFIMIFELVSVFLGILIFSIKNHSICYDYDNYYNLSRRDDSDNDENIAKIKLGIPIFLILIIGVLLLFYNRYFLERYIVLGTKTFVVPEVSGLLSIIVFCFFLIVYVYLLKTIKVLKWPDFLKIVLSLLLCVFFINGFSISGSNVSRWNILISSIISYIFIIKLFPNYKKIFSFLLVIAMIFAVTFASMIKFEWNDNYSSLWTTINKEFSYSTLNAYFSGPINMQTAISLKKDLDNSKISKFKIFFSDTFGNFPMLNRFLSNDSYRSDTLFNLKIYGSSIAKDQIIPYSGQVYIYFGMLFVFFEIFQFYLSLYLFFISKKENNFLKVFNCILISFFLSLVNCVNYSIIMQSIWIYAFPVFIINKINNKTIIK